MQPIRVLDQLKHSLLWFSGLIIILISSVLFMPLSEQTSQISVGSYSFDSFPSGLALYSGSTDPQYYSISPLNDYFITQSGYRVTLLSGESYSSEKFKKTLNQSKPEALLSAITNYLGITKPSYHLQRNEPVEYLVKRNSDNQITITRHMDIPAQHQADITAITLAYNPEDIVFSAQEGSVFSENQVSVVSYLQDKIDKQLTYKAIPDQYRNTNLFTWEVEGDEVIIVNPNHPGYIVITKQRDQTILVNPKSKLIEVIESVTDHKTQTTQLQISVRDDLGK